MRYFRVKEQPNGELKIFEYNDKIYINGRVGEMDLGHKPVDDIYDALVVISDFCPGPKKVIIEITIDET
jgi:hypothetical protein